MEGQENGILNKDFTRVRGGDSTRNQTMVPTITSIRIINSQRQSSTVIITPVENMDTWRMIVQKEKRARTS